MISTEFSIYHLEYYLLIVARVAGMFAAAPIYSTRGVPRRVRLGLALCTAMAMIMMIPYEPLNYTTIIEFSVLLVKEVVLGLSVGLASSLCLTIINLAGMFIDREIGLTMVMAFDPSTNSQATISADFYTYMVILIMLCTNMHHFIIRAICDSFTLIPVGGVDINTVVYKDIVILFLTEFFVLAFRISLPIFISIMLVNIVLGVLAKTSPQMNMFSVGIELKLIVGLIILIALVIFLPNITEFVTHATEDIVTDFLYSMAGS